MNLFSAFDLRADTTTVPPMIPSIVPFMGSQSSFTRTSTSGMPMDTRREATPFQRRELVKKSRWLYNNLGLIKKFVNGVARYATGTGISPMPATGSYEFDIACETYFCDWADSNILCDVRKKLSFWRMQKHVTRSMFRDGDSFVLKAPNPPEIVIPGQAPILGLPRLQWLEGQVIDNEMWQNGTDHDEDGFREGIKCDPYGATTWYRMLTDSAPNQIDLRGKSKKIPAEAMLHLYDVERASQLRGLPWLYTGANSALDVMDLVALEKHAAKLHAAMAAAIKKRSGDAGKKGFTGDLTKQTGTDSQGQPRVIAFENFFGGAGILQMKLDEEFQLLNSTRPSQTFTGFIDYLIREIAAGFGVPVEFIWSCMGLGGPNLRMVLEDAKWFIEEVQDLIVHLFCQPVYMWVIARGIERGDLVVPAEVTNPYGVAWQGPAKITVDQGKEGNLELERLANGCGTWEEYWNARGKSGRHMVFKRIDEIAEAMEYASKKKVPFDYVIALKKGGDGDAGKGADSPDKPKTPPDDDDED